MEQNCKVDVICDMLVETDGLLVTKSLTAGVLWNPVFFDLTCIWDTKVRKNVFLTSPLADLDPSPPPKFVGYVF